MKGAAPGFHSVTPTLIFKDAKAAIALYQKAFGATQDYCLIPTGGTQVMHACLTLGDSKIFLCDENPAMGTLAPGAQGSSVNFYLYFEDADKAYAQAVSAGMTGIMPVADMFWGDRIGCVKDAFGYKWNIATFVRKVAPDELQKAADQMMTQAKPAA